MRMFALLGIGAAFVSAFAVEACSSDSTTTNSTKDGGTSSADGAATGSDGSAGGGKDSSVSDNDAGSGNGNDAGSTTDSGGNADGGSAACIAYCDCMAMYCPTSLGTPCLAACAAQTTWDLTCRTTHCGYAAADAVTHCPHAAGVNTCQ
jgi:hypothetical protein